MMEWIKNLEPEFLIIFVGLLFLLVVSIAIFIDSKRTLSLIGKRALRLSEDLVIRRERKIVDILISNTSFISVKVAAVGYIFKKNLLPISEEVIEIAPRDSLKISIEIDALEAVIYKQENKLRKLKIYVEDTLGRRTIYKAKDSFRTLEKIAKDARKALKKQAKKQRFETGKYNFYERFGLVIKYIFSPVTKLNSMFKKNVNRRLKERETRLVLKKKEREHTAFLKSIAEEDRREKELHDLENKIVVERKEFEKKQKLKQQKLLEEKKLLQEEKAKLEVNKTIEKQKKDKNLTEKEEKIDSKSSVKTVEKLTAETKKPEKKLSKDAENKKKTAKKA